MPETENSAGELSIESINYENPTRHDIDVMDTHMHPKYSLFSHN